MEIFITDQHDQYIIGNGDGDWRMAFLMAPLSPRRGGDRGDQSEDLYNWNAVRLIVDKKFDDDVEEQNV
jgi:hypothetical protein